MGIFRINELLSEREMTFGDLSEGINVGRTNLYNYISESNKTITVLIRIAEYLEVSVGDLFNKEQLDFLVRGYLELEDDIYIIESHKDLDYYNQKLSEYLEENKKENNEHK